MFTQAVERRGRTGRGSGWLTVNPLAWMAAAFAIAAILAAVTLGVLGAGDRGTAIALRLTARWSFLLFWLAYAGGAAGKLLGTDFYGVARHGREFGLAFASSLLVHVGLIVWLYYIAAEPGGAMAFFWVGILGAYLLALFSVPAVRDAINPRIWRTFRTIGMEYIALVFADDFIRIPLQEHGVTRYPLTYVPFALMLIGGLALQVTVFVRSRFTLPFCGQRIQHLSHRRLGSATDGATK